MSDFSGKRKGAAVALLGAALVGGAAWVQFGREKPVAEAPLEIAVLPKEIVVEDAPQAAVPASVETNGAGPVDPAAQEDEQAGEAVSEPEAPETAQAAKEIPEETVDEPVVAPAFDEVRRETDGMTVIAGRAAPQSEVTVLLNGAEISTTRTDGNGKFAAIAMIEPDGQGHILSLAQNGVASEGQIILAPLEAPVEVAVAEVVKPQAPVAEIEAVVEPETLDAEITQDPASEPETDTQTAAVETEADETAADEAPTVEQVDAPEQPQDVAVLRTTDEGVELLNTKAPEVMDTVALDTISYSDVGDVQLAGRAQSETRAVRVYLNNNAVVSLVVDDAGRWRGDLPDVDEGIYTLRVDEVSNDGTVTSRVETPFKRESPEVLAAAVAGQDGPLKKVTVQKGATLWAIAEARYGSGLLYVNVVNANESDIRNPDLIYPGQVFELPD